MSLEPETLFKTSEALVRLMALAPDEVGTKHYHSCLFETVICVEGEIALFVAGNDHSQVLLPGQQASVPSPLAHWLENRRPTPSRYILAQNGGAYDFMPLV